MNLDNSCHSTGDVSASTGKRKPCVPHSTHIGKRFGKLLVLSAKNPMFLCRCDCGTTKIIRAWNVITDRQKSCGCEVRSHRGWKNWKKLNKGEYLSWAGMKKRCTYVKGKEYKYYGGRGISICERWEDFENFLTDMGPRPEGLTLDRIDVNGNYEPGNCRWISMEEQLGNKRCTQWVVFNGEKMCLRKACRLSGVDHNSIAHQPARGIKPAQKAFDDALLKLF